MQYEKLKSRLGSTIARRNELQQQLTSVSGQDESLLAGRISWLNRQITALRRNMRATGDEPGQVSAGQRLDTVVAGVYTLDIDRFDPSGRFRGQFEADVEFNTTRTHFTLASFSTEVSLSPTLSGVTSAVAALAGLAAGTVDRASGAVTLRLPLCVQYSVEVPMGSYQESSSIDFVLSTDCGSPLNGAGWFTLQGYAAFTSGKLQERVASLSVTGQFSAPE